MTVTKPPMLTVPLPKTGQQRAWWRQPDSRSAWALALRSAAQQHDGLLLAITHDTHTAQVLEQDLHAFGGDLPVMHFPDWETLPYDLFSPHPDIVSQRIAALYRLPSLRRGIFVLPVQTLMQRLPPTGYIAGGTLMLKLGQRLNLEDEKRRLETAGYRNVPQVLDPGDFAVRGSLLDIYAMGASEPYRIELLDDEIDAIRPFDPETQRSSGKLDAIELLPGREFPMDEAASKRVREILRERFPIDPRRCPVYQDLKGGGAPAGIEYYLPLFFDDTATLFDYLPKNALLALDAGVLESAEAFWMQTGERYEQRRHDIERPILPPAEILLPSEHLRHQFNATPLIETVAKAHARFSDADDLGVQHAPELPLNVRDAEPAAALKSFLASYPGRVLIAADSAGRREALLEALGAGGIKPGVVANWEEFCSPLPAGEGLGVRVPVSGELDAIPGPHPNLTSAVADARSPGGRGALPAFATVAAFDNGFAISEPPICVLTERQLYPDRAGQPRRRRRSDRDPDSIIRDLSEIAEGSPIVHEDHGVGRYRGLVTLNVGDTPAEFLEIEYAKGDKLYVPVAQLHLVSRYSGASPDAAPLHSLGGEQWEKAKKRAAQKVRDVAAELLEIQARREARKGRALQTDRTMYEQFAAGFPFEETPDQQQAIEAVIDDLARERPMDRVVCGDVGFGKTEVAVRAAFAAAMAGKQVAVLVPTTLLAQQHYQNFRDRFADWPVRVDVLSRFKSARDNRAELDRVERGEIDVIVGTHRLLQEDVKFKDLGLVIVDEEQRFGVRQKERLKALRAEVHLLTLTATPIPRTLNMSMAGLRDLSLIATPPQNRVAVKTFITPWDASQLREAFQRELARGGQIYFLHNQVESIERRARELAELVPEARIRIGHGQMPERELEQVMLDFHRQRFNVLVATTIIESGIDIPNANTIIIDRADRFGLAQLHQLRGRVGRSHHRAYAYLLIPEGKAMTADARKRLEAIASLEELGAGFTLATHDLEIRGAGELLGEEQSGQITEVGFSLYTELLERAVKSIRDGKLPDLDADSHHGATVELHIPALIPDNYLPDVHTRLTLYKRIANARSTDDLRDLQVEMIDRFGLLPDPLKNLFAMTALKLEATAIGITKIDLGANGGRINFSARPNIDPLTVIRLVQTQPNVYRMDGPGSLRIKRELWDADARFVLTRELLDRFRGKAAP